MKKILRSLLIMSLCVLVVGSAAMAAEWADRQVLQAGIMHADIGRLDPHSSPAAQDVFIMDGIFNGLVRFKPGTVDPAQIEPDLAVSWETSEDGLTWTFNLRQGVQFHKGYGEFTSDDVVFSLNRVRDPEISAFVGDYAAIESVEAIDRYTVKIVLKHQIPSLLSLVADYHGGNIVSRKAVEELGDSFALNPIGTGPFAFHSHVAQQRVELVRHEEYFRGTPRLEKVIYRFMPDLRSRQLALQSGELHLIEGASEQWWIEEMKNYKDITVDLVGPGELATLHMNLTRAPLDDIRVRQAIAHAIDQDELREFIGIDMTVHAPSIIPIGYLGHTSDVRQYEHDPAKAKELLAQAGFPNGLDLGRVVITSNEGMRRPMEVIQEQLRRSNIIIDLAVVDHPTFHSQIRLDVNPLVLYYAARFPIADVYLTQFYHSSSIVQTPTAVTNFSHYGEGELTIDEYIEKARVETDLDKQISYWEQAQIQAAEDLPSYPLFIRNQIFARKANVHLGYEPESNMVQFYRITEETGLLR